MEAKSPKSSQKRRTAPKRIGPRELSKQESQHKIMLAARHLFSEAGYDCATLRQIAARAGLTAGALFNHVTDKRDLIYLIFNEEVDQVTDLALAAPRAYQSFRDKILTVTEHYYRLFASEPVLSRILLNELVIETPGMHLERNRAIRARLLQGMERLAADAKRAGEIRTDENPAVVAEYIFFVYAASLRRWLGSIPLPEWRMGHRMYERFLTLQIEGLRHSPEAEQDSMEPAHGTAAGRDGGSPATSSA